MATIMPPGMLFRGGAEPRGRTRHFIEYGVLEAVIGLPAGLLPQAPASRRYILVIERGGGSRATREQCAVHQRRPGVPRGQEPELPAPRRHRQDRARLSQPAGRSA